MRNVNVLDCTLRDGGYVNNWMFGKRNIISIIDKLGKAGIDIIECGFLSNKQIYTNDQTQFNTLSEIEMQICNPRKNSIYVCMINYGEYKLGDIPIYSGGLISGIRVVFHKFQIDEAIEFCNQLIKRGYKIFVQPMVTINYNDYELLNLVEKTNKISPYAFYIVDSFGVMKQADLKRMFYLVDNNLKKETSIGYHSHNNMQLAYSNAQALVNITSDRNAIIDCSVFGMGRGAGNLNTELFVDYLNFAQNKSYKIEYLLEIIDSVLNNIYNDNYWGYSLEHYLSAAVNCHPNYASYLSEKNVLNMSSMRAVLLRIESNRKETFDKDYIEQLYKNYQDNKIDDKVALNTLSSSFNKNKILLVAPGKSIIKYQKKILDFIDRNNPIIISVNFLDKFIQANYIFISNKKRFELLLQEGEIKSVSDKLILTSNILNTLVNSLVVNYNSLLNTGDGISDNAMLMIINLLIRCGIKDTYIAGFDGYIGIPEEDYFENHIPTIVKSANANSKNENISKALKNVMNEINLNFITPTKYDLTI